MVERIGEIEKGGAEQVDQSVIQPFVWESSFVKDKENVAKFNPIFNLIDEVTVRTHSPEGNYERGLSTEDEHTILAYTRRSKTTLTRVHKSLALADFSGNAPVGDLLREKVIEPIFEQKQKEVGKTEFESFKRRPTNAYWKAFRELETNHGPSFETSHAAYLSEAAKAAGRLVTHIVVPRTVADAEAAGAVHDETTQVAKVVFGMDLATGQQEAKSKTALGDVKVDTPAKETTGTFTGLEAGITLVDGRAEREERMRVILSRPEILQETVEEAFERHQQARQEVEPKKGFRARVQNRWNKIMKKEDGNYNKKRVAALGALAVIATGVAANYGLHATGHEGVIAQVSDAASYAISGIKSFLGLDHHSTVAQHADKINIKGNPLDTIKETAKHATQTGGTEHITNTAAQHLPDHTTMLSSQTGSDVIDVVTKAANHGHPHIVAMPEGSSASQIAHNYVVNHFSNATPSQVNQLTGIGWENLLHSNGLTAADAHHIGANSTLDAGSMIQRIDSAGRTLGLSRAA